VIVWVIVLVVLVFGGLAAAGIYVANNYESLIAKGVTKAIVSTVSASGLPKGEKAEIIAIVDRLKQDYLAGEVTLEDLQAVLQSVGTSPALKVGMVVQFEAGYVMPSALDAEEKRRAHIDLNRFAQGLCRKEIGWESLDQATRPLSVIDGSGGRRLKSPRECSPEDIRGVLALIRAYSDQAGIPNAVVNIDVSEEFRKSVEAALGRPIG
jgi:hypothetical protein